MRKLVAHLQPRLYPSCSLVSPLPFEFGRVVVQSKIANPGPPGLGLPPVCFQPGEERRTHQWSFKPSAATVLSHAAVFLPAGSRYVGVQQGSTLVSWRESEQDVKRPLSCQVTYATAVSYSFRLQQ